MNFPPSDNQSRAKSATPVALVGILALVLIVVLALVLTMIIYESGQDEPERARIEIPFDDGTLTMTKEDLIDFEITHKPTERQMKQITKRIDQQWESAMRLWEQKGLSGSPSVFDLIKLAAESGNPILTFAEIAAEVGRPHKYGYSSLFHSYVWITTNGKEYEISFRLPEDAPVAEPIIDEDGTVVNETFWDERYNWVMYYYGIAR